MRTHRADLVAPQQALGPSAWPRATNPSSEIVFLPLRRYLGGVRCRFLPLCACILLMTTALTLRPPATGTRPPVDLYCYYLFLQREGSEDTLDFWLDVQQHENLCTPFLCPLSPYCRLTFVSPQAVPTSRTSASRDAPFVKTGRNTSASLASAAPSTATSPASVVATPLLQQAITITSATAATPFPALLRRAVTTAKTPFRRRAERSTTRSRDSTSRRARTTMR